MAYGRRWALRAQAIDEASAKRTELEQQGWVTADGPGPNLSQHQVV